MQFASSTPRSDRTQQMQLEYACAGILYESVTLLRTFRAFRRFKQNFVKLAAHSMKDFLSMKHLLLRPRAENICSFQRSDGRAHFWTWLSATKPKRTHIHR